MAGNFSQQSSGWLPSGEASHVDGIAVVWHIVGRRAQNEVERAAVTTPWAASLACGLSISLLEFKTWY